MTDRRRERAIHMIVEGESYCHCNRCQGWRGEAALTGCNKLMHNTYHVIIKTQNLLYPEDKTRRGSNYNWWLLAHHWFTWTGKGSHDALERRAIQANVSQTCVVFDFEVAVQVCRSFVFRVTVGACEWRAFGVSDHMLFHFTPVSSRIATQLTVKFPITIDHSYQNTAINQVSMLCQHALHIDIASQFS